jgi:hypothetical protein
VPDAADLRPQLAGVAEKLAGRAPDVRVRHASRRRSELQAAPEAKPAAPEPYTPAGGRFAERSSAAKAAAEQPDARQWWPLAEYSSHRPEELPRREHVTLSAMSGDAPVARPQATMLPELPQLPVAPPVVRRQAVLASPEPPVALQRALPETLLQAGSRLPEVQVFLQVDARSAHASRTAPPRVASPVASRLPSAA